MNDTKTPVRYEKKPPAREVIIRKKVDDVRNKTIDNDLELSFLKELLQDIKDNKVNYDSIKTFITTEAIKSKIENLTSEYEFNIIKLKHLKDIRDRMKADKTKKYILKNTPNKIHIDSKA